MIPKAVSHLFWVSVQNGAANAGKEFDAEIVWDGPARETDTGRQIKIVDAMVAQRVDALAIAPSERKALVAPVERAVKAGIPVTIFDSGLEFENYVSYVATDNVEAGRMAARSLGEMLEGQGRIGMILHVPGSASTMEREQGFTETLRREFPRIRITGSQYGLSDPATSRMAADRILNEDPRVNALFASSEPSSVGAAAAIKARGLEEKVFLLAFDSSEAMVDDLRGGAIDAMVVQDPQRMGYEAVRTLIAWLRGQTPPRRLDLNAVVVQKKDLNEPNVKRLLSLT